jgi:hypothetical protein
MPSLGGATGWLNSEPLGPATLRRCSDVASTRLSTTPASSRLIVAMSSSLRSVSRRELDAEIAGRERRGWRTLRWRRPRSARFPTRTSRRSPHRAPGVRVGVRCARKSEADERVGGHVCPDVSAGEGKAPQLGAEPWALCVRRSFKPFGDVSVYIAAGVDVARIALAGVDRGLVGRAAVAAGAGLVMRGGSGSAGRGGV